MAVICQVRGCANVAITYCPSLDWHICRCCSDFAAGALGLLVLDLPPTDVR